MPELYVLPDTMDDTAKHPQNTPPSSEDQPLLIMLAHGSRDSRWCQTFENGLESINARLDDQAVLAYMEMASPSLETIISNHFLAGTRVFHVLPLFFAQGRHLLHDVPEQIRELEARYPGTTITLMPAVGHQPGFWDSLGDLIGSQINPGRVAG